MIITIIIIIGKGTFLKRAHEKAKQDAEEAKQKRTEEQAKKRLFNEWQSNHCVPLLSADLQTITPEVTEEEQIVTEHKQLAQMDDELIGEHCATKGELMDGELEEKHAAGTIILFILIIISVILLLQWRKGQLATKRKEADLEILPRIINNRSRANKKQEPEIPADNDTSQVHYVTSVIVDDSPSCDDTVI
ncbi:hypothetical protein LSAT2_023357 [Lamellibrachia satsuma]|nr:hypothetical protein LSAT2_023357 [Lamellibrachia satsuma]